MLKRITALQSWCGCGSSLIKGYRHCSVASANQKFLNVAIIGAPNAGKSTLVNNLVGNRVSAVTHVANTTRTLANGILNIDDTQLVFTDTPGVVSYEEGRRLKMHQIHVRTPNRVARNADIIAVVTDIYCRKTKNYIDENILNIMNEHEHIPTVLVMNKIDKLKRKEELLLLTTLLTSDRKKDEYGYQHVGGSGRFLECFFTCAQTGEGVDDFLYYLLLKAKPSRWEYSSDMYCDSSVQAQIADVFREKLLIMFGQEIPWQVKQETIVFYTDNGFARIHQQLTWPKKSQRRYVLTKEEELKKESVLELQNMFKCPIDLTMDISQKDKMTKDDLLILTLPL